MKPPFAFKSCLTLQFVILSALSASTLAQGENEEITPLVTDRPDFTESAETIARGRVQIEGGVTFERSGDERAQSWGEVLMRIGTSENTELRIGLPSRLRLRGEGQSVSGFDDAFIGGKWVLRRGEGTSPQVALLAGSTVPTGSRRVAERAWQPEAVLAASIDLSESTALASNVGYSRSRSAGQRFNSFFGSVSLAHSLNSRWGAYLEAFAFNRTEPGGDSQKFVNTGVTYLVNEDFQLDARIGTGLGNSVRGSEYFWGVGAAHRF